MKKVLIPTKLDKVARELLEKHGGYKVAQDDATPLPDLIKANPDTYALIVRSEKVPADVIDALPQLKVIIRAGAGVNTIDIKHARKKGIDVMNTPGANSNAVAEEVIALILADLRHLIKADPSCRKGEWEKKAFMGRELTGKTVGIVGLGAIGALVAKRLAGFECRILGYDPFVSKDRADEIGVEVVDLPTLFAESDFITLHMPENEQTRNLVNAALIGRMKAGATLVNCARAGILVEEDLRKLKAEKKLRFLNDVFPKDIEGPKTCIDIADIMVPHLGASTKEANFNAAKRSAEQLLEYDDKGVTSYVVNRDIPEGLESAYCDLAYTLARMARAVAGQGAPVKLIETSFYGTLKPFARWLITPVAAGVGEGEVDRSLDAEAVRRYLRERGIEMVDRETDAHKGYKNSITVDVTVSLEGDTLRRASVRGTVAEGHPMIARIDDFDQLYFAPKGHTVMFAYRDRPGVLGRIGSMLAEAGINIDDVRNPHDAKGENSLAILKVNRAVPPATITALAQAIEAHLAIHIEL